MDFPTLYTYVPVNVYIQCSITQFCSDGRTNCRSNNRRSLTFVLNKQFLLLDYFVVSIYFPLMARRYLTRCTTARLASRFCVDTDTTQRILDYQPRSFAILTSNMLLTPAQVERITDSYHVYIFFGADTRSQEIARDDDSHPNSHDCTTVSHNGDVSHNSDIVGHNSGVVGHDSGVVGHDSGAVRVDDRDTLACFLRRS